MLFKGYDMPICQNGSRFILLFLLFWVSSRHIMIYSIAKESINTDEFESEF